MDTKLRPAQPETSGASPTVVRAVDTVAPLLSVRHLSLEFHKDGQILPAVEDVSFDIAAGETLCLVGESGCG